MRIFVKNSFLVIIIISFFSCKKETSWDIDAAIPIARSHLNISNFFGDTIFKEDASGLVHLSFSKEILNLTIDSLVKLPDTTVNIGYTALFNASLNPGDLIYSNAGMPSNQEIAFDVANGVQLNKAIVRSGFLKIEYFNTITSTCGLKDNSSSEIINALVNDNNSKM